MDFMNYLSKSALGNTPNHYTPGHIPPGKNTTPQKYTKRENKAPEQ